MEGPFPPGRRPFDFLILPRTKFGGGGPRSGGGGRERFVSAECPLRFVALRAATHLPRASRRGGNSRAVLAPPTRFPRKLRLYRSRVTARTLALANPVRSGRKQP